MNNLYAPMKTNSHRGYANIAKNVLDLLIKRNESIFKLLKLDAVNIIPHEDSENIYYEMDIEGEPLTRDEKEALIFKTNDDASLYRIQLQQSSDDAISETQCRLHIYTDDTVPIGNEDWIALCFDVICHNKYNMINNGSNQRIDCITEELLNFLDGLYLEGCVGNIAFDYKNNKIQNYVRSNIDNKRNCFGKQIKMLVKLSILESKNLR